MRYDGLVCNRGYGKTVMELTDKMHIAIMLAGNGNMYV
jgi:hypothetical protein